MIALSGCNSNNISGLEFNKFSDLGKSESWYARLDNPSIIELARRENLSSDNISFWDYNKDRKVDMYVHCKDSLDKMIIIIKIRNGIAIENVALSNSIIVSTNPPRITAGRLIRIPAMNISTDAMSSFIFSLLRSNFDTLLNPCKISLNSLSMIRRYDMYLYKC